MRILLVEHEDAVAHELMTTLRAHDHAALLVRTADQAVNALEADPFDVVLFNRRPAGSCPQETLERLQACRHPALILFSKAGHERTALPSQIPDLLLKWPGATSATPSLLMAGDLSLDTRSHEVMRGGQNIVLTDTEFQLLRILLEHRGEVVRRRRLLEEIWGYDFDPETNMIDVHMSKLRGKIDRPFPTALLKTVRAVGYLIA